MSEPIDLGITVNEGTTLIITRTIQDHTGAGIPAAQLTELKLTLYERASGAILASRDHQSVLNANGGTLDAEGVLTLELTPTDNVRATAGAEESHCALLEWKYAAGARRGKGELLFGVRRVPKAALA